MWLLAGLGLGTFLGVLYAPRAGSETRQDIKDTVEEGRELIKQLGRDARESAITMVERAKTTLQYQRNQLGSAIEAGREAYRNAADEYSPDAEYRPT
jgi:gas vesicle protein